MAAAAWLAAGVPLAAAVCLLLLALLAWLASVVHDPRRLSLAGRHVLVTGGSSGIGLAVAALVAKQGAKVTIVARDARKLAAAKSSVLAANAGAEVHTFAGDVANEESIQKAIEEAVRVVGKSVDVLICCAGAVECRRFDDASAANYRTQFDINCMGCVHAARACLPSMKAAGVGRIVFVSSMAGQFGLFGYAAYSASKYAVRGVADVLYQELAAYRDVRVSIVYPPDTDTPQYHYDKKRQPPELKAQLAGSTLFTPERVAGDIVEGAKKGAFTVYTGFDGWLVSTLTSGMSPEPLLLRALQQVACLSVLRIASLFYVSSLASTVRRVPTSK
eukprot:jgi/Chlat1/3594/Chrsp234S03573